MKHSKGTSIQYGEQLCQIILNSITNTEVLIQTNPDGWTHAWMHAQTHIHISELLITMSRSPQMGLTKKKKEGHDGPGFRSPKSFSPQNEFYLLCFYYPNL